MVEVTGSSECYSYFIVVVVVVVVVVVIIIFVRGNDCRCISCFAEVVFISVAV